MQRIDDATAATSLPAPEAAGTPGYFTEGNPTAGTPATNVRGSWLNMVQEELMAVVAAGGLTPSKTTYTQVRDAIKVIAAGQFTQSFATNGYQKLPSGLIRQWGRLTATLTAGGNTSSSITFPLAFPTACASVNCSIVTTTPTGVSTQPGTVPSTTGFTQYFFSSTVSATTTAFWEAIGY